MNITSMSNFYILNGKKAVVINNQFQNIEVVDSSVNLENKDICLTISNSLINFIRSSFRIADDDKNTDEHNNFIDKINEILNEQIDLFENIVCSVAFSCEKQNVIQLLNNQDVSFNTISDVLSSVEQNEFVPYKVYVELSKDEQSFQILFYEPTHENKNDCLLLLNCDLL